MIEKITSVDGFSTEILRVLENDRLSLKQNL